MEHKEGEVESNGKFQRVVGVVVMLFLAGFIFWETASLSTKVSLEVKYNNFVGQFYEGWYQGACENRGGLEFFSYKNWYRGTVIAMCADRSFVGDYLTDEQQADIRTTAYNVRAFAEKLK